MTEAALSEKNSDAPAGNYVAAAKLVDLEDDQGLFVELEGVQIVLFKTEDDGVHAIGNVCPHQGAPLAEGWYEQEECVVTCALHAWDFDVRTGQRVNGPESVPSYDTRIVNGIVEVALNNI
ncbi:MAG: Rieske (2Fe-2S) protein [Gammaproteobacteria bacterium]|jgi:nitrite reductase/ring-hydroxylating ferredoxin subunit|nr:Rieske (2Fe-2S) protein [Gammaproteobacteria bacterium]